VLESRRLWMAAILALLLLPSLAVASGRPDFTGRWQLDRQASDSVEPILAAQGIGWFKRKVVAGLAMTQHIEQRGDTIDVVIETTYKTRSQRWIADGKPRPVDIDDGNKAVSAHRFAQGSLVTVTTGTSEGGEAYTLRSTRSLLDGGQTMQVVLACTIGDDTLRATRVFRREG